MGVDYFTCSVCDETFCDCGHWGICSCGEDLCGYCFDEQKEKYGENEDGELNKCDLCTGVILTESDYHDYLVHITGKTHDEIDKDIRVWRYCQ